jgi:hypothetical protein
MPGGVGGRKQGHTPLLPPTRFEWLIGFYLILFFLGGKGSIIFQQQKP